MELGVVRRLFGREECKKVERNLLIFLWDTYQETKVSVQIIEIREEYASESNEKLIFDKNMSEYSLFFEKIPDKIYFNIFLVALGRRERWDGILIYKKMTAR